jgi:hypothetical protein
MNEQPRARAGSDDPSALVLDVNDAIARDPVIPDDAGRLTLRRAPGNQSSQRGVADGGRRMMPNAVAVLVGVLACTSACSHRFLTRPRVTSSPGGAGTDAAPPPDDRAVALGDSADRASGSDPVCTALAQLALGPPVWSGPSPSPGVTSTLSIPLTNRGAADFPTAPGVLLQADSAAVGIDFPRFDFFGLLAGQTVTATWEITFGASLASGAVVRFRAEPVASSTGPADAAPCAAAAQATIDLSVTVL